METKSYSSSPTPSSISETSSNDSDTFSLSSSLSSTATLVNTEIISGFSPQLPTHYSKRAHTISAAQTQARLVKRKSSFNLITKFFTNDPDLPPLSATILEQCKTPLTKSYIWTNEKIGGGAEGDVFLILRKSDSKKFAAKKFHLRGDIEDQAVYLDRIAQEFYLTSILHNENCTQLIDMVSHNKHLVAILPYYSTDLFASVEAGLNQSQISDYFKQICTAIGYLHNYKIFHLDLKIENICLLTSEVESISQIKVIDFGCAKTLPSYNHQQQLSSLRLETSPSSSNASAWSGSDAYLPPERYNTSKPKNLASVDLWGLGIIFLVMNLGKLPWLHAHKSDNNYKAFLNNPEAWLAVNLSRVSSEELDVIVNLLRLDPMERKLLI
jgi:serine/threonine protein kinase